SGEAMISQPALWCSPIHASSKSSRSRCSISSRSRSSATVGFSPTRWNGAMNTPNFILFGRNVITIPKASWLRPRLPEAPADSAVGWRCCRTRRLFREGRNKDRGIHEQVLARHPHKGLSVAEGVRELEHLLAVFGEPLADDRHHAAPVRVRPFASILFHGQARFSENVDDARTVIVQLTEAADADMQLPAGVDIRLEDV